MKESQLQTKIIRWLKDHGCYVIKTQPQPGIPSGCPDVIALYRDIWIAIEVKALSTSSFQVGQQVTLERLRKGNYFVYVAHPDNWEEIQQDISDRAFIE